MKKLFNTSMSIILIVTICFMVFLANFGFAQNKYLKNKIEKKADKSTFVVYDGNETTFVFNKKNTLTIYESSFVKKTDGIDANVVKFNERQKVDDLVYKIIAPFYKNYKSKYSDKISGFDIFLHSKTDGKVCELTFEYNKDTNIPLTAIEKLEGEILALGLSLEFDPNSYFTKDALWVYYPVKYSVFRMKEKLKTENK